MSLPRIAPYELDLAALAEENVTSWRLDVDRAVLLVHDMQNHFIGAYDRSTASQIDVAIHHTRSLVEAARRTGVPVVYTAQPPAQDPADRGLLTDFWGPGLQHPAAADIAADLAPHPEDVVLTKWRYSAFYRSDLRERMRLRGRDQLIVTGVYAHIGCLVTSMEAFMDGVRVFFVADAMADFSAEDHAMAARYVARRCGQVCTADEVLSALVHPHLGAA